MKPEYPAELLGSISRVVPFSEQHRDAPEYLHWLRDYEVIRTLNLPAYWTPVDEAEVRRYCTVIRNSDSDYFFALADRNSGKFIGTLRAGHIDWQVGIADIGIMIGHKEAWGKGHAQDSIAALACWLFADLGMRRLTAGAMAINPAMIRVFEKLGFRREGVLRQQDRLREGGFCDHILLGCFREEFVATRGGTAAHHVEHNEA